MDMGQILTLNRLLKTLYPEQFPGLPRAMADVWLERLRQHDEDLVMQAVQRWAMHHTFKACSLDELLEQVDLIREDEARSRLPTQSRRVADILRDAAEAQAANPLGSEDDATYGHLMATLGIRSCDHWKDEGGAWHAKMTMSERRDQCFVWAAQFEFEHPTLSANLHATARQFAQMVAAQEARL